MKFEHQKLLASIPLLIIGVLLKAAVLVKAWELIVMTSFEVPQITFQQAVAVLIIIVMLPRLSNSKDELDECENIRCFLIKAISRMLTSNAAYLVLAYVFYWFAT